VVEVSEANKLWLPLASSTVRLMLTARVTVASNERSFSQLKFVKNKVNERLKADWSYAFNLLVRPYRHSWLGKIKLPVEEKTSSNTLKHLQMANVSRSSIDKYINTFVIYSKCTDQIL
jgi:hypothetical protein